MYPMSDEHTITDDLSTEESEGYTQFLQTYGVQFNNIMNLDIKVSKKVIVKRKRRRKFLSGRSPCQC